MKLALFIFKNKERKNIVTNKLYDCNKCFKSLNMPFTYKVSYHFGSKGIPIENTYCNNCFKKIKKHPAEICSQEGTCIYLNELPKHSVPLIFHPNINQTFTGDVSIFEAHHLESEIHDDYSKLKHATFEKTDQTQLEGGYIGLPVNDINNRKQMNDNELDSFFEDVKQLEVIEKKQIEGKHELVWNKKEN